MEKVTHVPWNTVLPQDVAYMSGYVIIDPPPFDDFGMRPAVAPVTIDGTFYREVLSEHERTGESIQHISDRIRCTSV